MPNHRPTRVQPRPLLVRHDTDDTQSTNRMVSAIADILPRLSRLSDSTMTVDLVIGDNQIVHNLGRKPEGVSITPSVATIAFAWAMTSADEKLATLSVVGSDMPSAGLRFY